MKSEKELAKLINVEALEELRDGNSFDTQQIWDAIGGLDALCDAYHGEGGIREQLFELYKIADEVINNDDYYSLEDEETQIYHLADELSFEFGEASEHLERLESALRNLTDLYPLEDEFDEEDDEDDADENEDEEEPDDQDEAYLTDDEDDEMRSVKKIDDWKT